MSGKKTIFPDCTFNITVSASKAGDVNGDGSVTISDVQAVLDALGATSGSCDVNGDGSVDISDVQAVLDLLE